MKNRLDKEERPEIYNLLSLMAAATNQSMEAVFEQYKVALRGEFHVGLLDGAIQAAAGGCVDCLSVSDPTEVWRAAGKPGVCV